MYNLSRRSTRVFKEEKLKTEDLEQILLAGKYAPSGDNMQPWHFTVISNNNLIEEIGEDSKNIAKNIDNEHLQKLANNSKFKPFYNAPTIVFISGDSKQFTSREDCALAGQNIMLAAESLGIGSVFLEFPIFAFNESKKEYYKEKLEIPKDYEVFYAISLGYKKGETKAAPRK